MWRKIHPRQQQEQRTQEIHTNNHLNHNTGRIMNSNNNGPTTTLTLVDDSSFHSSHTGSSCNTFTYTTISEEHQQQQQQQQNHRASRRNSITSSSTTSSSHDVQVSVPRRAVSSVLSASSSTSTSASSTTSLLSGRLGRRQHGIEKSIRQLFQANPCRYDNQRDLIQYQLVPLLQSSYGIDLYPAIVFGHVDENGALLTNSTTTTIWIDYFTSTIANTNTNTNEDDGIVANTNVPFPNECVWDQNDTESYTRCKDNMCLVLSGTIPYTFNRNTYGQFIDIYLPYPSFPSDPPLVFVRKRTTVLTCTTDSTIEEVFCKHCPIISPISGQVFSDYLSSWRKDNKKWNLLTLLQQLSQTFSNQPPVRRRRREQQQHQQQQQQLNEKQQIPEQKPLEATTNVRQQQHHQLLQQEQEPQQEVLPQREHQESHEQEPQRILVQQEQHVQDQQKQVEMGQQRPQVLVQHQLSDSSSTNSFDSNTDIVQLPPYYACTGLDSFLPIEAPTMQIPTASAAAAAIGTTNASSSNTINNNILVHKSITKKKKKRSMGKLKVDIATLIKQTLLRSQGCIYNDKKKLLSNILEVMQHDDINLEPAIVTGGQTMPKTTTTQWILSTRRTTNITFPDECIWDPTDTNLYSRCKNNKCIALSGVLYLDNEQEQSQRIDLYLPHPTFPKEPPVVYVRKSSNDIYDVDQYEQVFATDHINVSAKDGKIYSDYLTQWDSETSTLVQFLKQLVSSFRNQPPVVLQERQQQQQKQPTLPTTQQQPEPEQKTEELQQVYQQPQQFPSKQTTCKDQRLEMLLAGGNVVIAVDKTLQKQEELRRKAGRKGSNESNVHNNNMVENENTQKASNCRPDSISNMSMMNTNDRTQKISNVNTTKHHSTSSLTDLFGTPIFNIQVTVGETKQDLLSDDHANQEHESTSRYLKGQSFNDVREISDGTTMTDPHPYDELTVLSATNEASPGDSSLVPSAITGPDESGFDGTSTPATLNTALLIDTTTCKNSIDATPITTKSTVDLAPLSLSSSTTGTSTSTPQQCKFKIIGVNTKAAIARESNNRSNGVKGYNTSPMKTGALVQVPKNGFHRRCSSMESTGSNTSQLSFDGPVRNTVYSGPHSGNRESLHAVSLPAFPNLYAQVPSTPLRQQPYQQQETTMTPSSRTKNLPPQSTVLKPEPLLGDLYQMVKVQIQLDLLRQSEQKIDTQLKLYRQKKQQMVRHYQEVQRLTRELKQTLSMKEKEEKFLRAVMSSTDTYQEMDSRNVNDHRRSNSFSQAPLDYSICVFCNEMKLKRNIIEIRNQVCKNDNINGLSVCTDGTNNSNTTVVLLKVGTIDEQIIQLEAEDEAYNDSIYWLHRALDNKDLTCECFVSTIRRLAKRQFYVRAYKQKILFLQEHRAAI